MITDTQLAFIPVGTNLAVTSAAIPSTNVIDILGQGAGTPPANIIGNVTLFGEDSGIGGLVPQIDIVVGTAFSGGTSLNIAFEGAPDLGTPTYLPGTYQIFNETGAMTAAQLTAGQVIRLNWFPVFPNTDRPRFLRLLLTPVGTFSAGTIAYAIVTMVRDDQANKQAAKNFTV